MSKRALKKAIRRVGNQAKVADKMRISRQAVNNWLIKGIVPKGRVDALAALSGVPRTELRPMDYVDD